MMAEDYLQQALKLATENVALNGGPFGALIVKDQKIIASSVNQVTKNNDPTAHAEIMAIRLACQTLNSFQLTGCLLYSSCEPCPMCLGAIYWARLSKVYYASTRIEAAQAGFDDRFIYDEIKTLPAQRKIIMQQKNHKEALTPFIAWQTQLNRIEY